MSARSRYLLQRDMANEQSELGKKAAQASDYLAREKRSSQIGGSMGAYAGIAAAGIIAGGPITWGMAAVGAGLGYLVGAKAGEEISERKETGKWNLAFGSAGEDKYSNEHSQWNQELKRGKFLKEDRKLTSESLMEAKKGTDLWGGIGKGALMASATAGMKYGALDGIKAKIKAGQFNFGLPEKKMPIESIGDIKGVDGKVLTQDAMNKAIKESDLTPEQLKNMGLKSSLDSMKPKIGDKPVIAGRTGLMPGTNIKGESLLTEQTVVPETDLSKNVKGWLAGEHKHGGAIDYSKVDAWTGEPIDPDVGEYIPTTKMADKIGSGQTVGEFVSTDKSVQFGDYVETDISTWKPSNLDKQPQIYKFDNPIEKGITAVTGEDTMMDGLGKNMVETGRSVGSRGEMPLRENVEFHKKFGTKGDEGNVIDTYAQKLHNKDAMDYGHNPFGLDVKGEGAINYEDTMGRDFVKAQKFQESTNKAQNFAGGNLYNPGQDNISTQIAAEENFIKGGATQTVGDASVTPVFDMNSIVKEGQTAQQAATESNVTSWYEAGGYDPLSKKSKMTQFMNQYNTLKRGAFQ